MLTAPLLVPFILVGIGLTVQVLSNAVKYSPDGGPVTVRAARDGDVVQVQEADRGMGMRPGDVERVFERFVRSHNARMSAIPGLGLAVAPEIVEAHGGSIGCESALGEGTVLTVSLPVRGPVEAGAQRPSPTRTEPSPEPRGARC